MRVARFMLDAGVGHNGGPHGHEKVPAQNFLEQNAFAKFFERLAQSPLRQGRKQDRRERDAPSQARYAAQRPERTRRQGEEPQAGDRDRALGSPQEGREGSPSPRCSCLTGSSPSSG